MTTIVSRPAAFGLRAHSGWTAVIAVSGTPRAPIVVYRGRMELCDSELEGSRQPYHAAEGLPLAKAKKIVDRCMSDAGALAKRGFDDLIRRLRSDGHRVVGCGLLLASGRPLPELSAILASHALIHTADGELFREALRGAARGHGIGITEIRERDLWERAEKTLRVRADELQASISALGKSIGPPWRQDEKLATAVGLLALASA